MQEKDVTELAGVGKVLGERLSKQGFDKAYVVLGQYLLLKKNKELFIEWFKEVSEGNNKQATDCHDCLRDWTDAFI